MSSLLITGANGFVGRHLLGKLDLRAWDKVWCLSRMGKPQRSDLRDCGKVEWVRGDLSNLGACEREFAGIDTVIHLAAVTGKARPEEYFEVNVEGTRALVSMCQRLSVRRFLYVSSIAVRFPEKVRYYYAQSKEQGEAIVRASGLRYTVIRPTLILGVGSPNLRSLGTLARLPIIPIFGDGQTLLQPIDVGDLVAFMILLLQRDEFHGETLELGGPERISVEDLLKEIHRRTSKLPPLVMHLPFSIVSRILRGLEKVFYRFLPVTLGQLSSFRYDGTIHENLLFEERRAELKTPSQMLDQLYSHVPR